MSGDEVDRSLMVAQMQARIDAAVVGWARSIPVDQIPGVVAFLFARLVSEGSTGPNSKDSGAGMQEADRLLRANELAKRLGVPESWVRTEESLADS